MWHEEKLESLIVTDLSMQC